MAFLTPDPGAGQHNHPLKDGLSINGLKSYFGFARGFARQAWIVAERLCRRDRSENSRQSGAPSNRDDRDLGAHRLLQGRRERTEVIRIDDDAIDVLSDSIFHIGDLLGRGALSVAFYESDVAELSRLGLDRTHHVYEERERQIQSGRQDRQVFVCGFSGRYDGQSEARCGRQASAFCGNFAASSVRSSCARRWGLLLCP